MWRALKAFWTKAYEDNLTGLAAMVAYTMMLSVFPLALVALFVAGRILSSPDVEASVVEDLGRLFPEAAQSTLLDGLRRVQESSTTVGIIAIIAAVWFSGSFWGALDTAFCRIYHRDCRTWVHQKVFAIGMIGVVLLFFIATVIIPTLQGLVARGTRDLPFGLGNARQAVYYVTLAGSFVTLFGLLCAVYWRVPRGPIPWRYIWPGALGAVTAIGVVDAGFPLYLANVTSLRIGTSFVFVLIVLVWFYALSLIILAGAVVNELRFEHDRDAAAAEPEAPAAAPDAPAAPQAGVASAGMAEEDTEQLHKEQIERVRDEKERARAADQQTEERQHERRAERADYLAEKLAERAESEERADDDA